MRINRLTIDGTGAQSADSLNYHGVRMQSCSSLSIGLMEVKSMNTTGYAAMFNTLAAGCYIETIKLNATYSRPAAVLNSVADPTDCNVGQVTGINGMTPITGGVTYKPFGRFREFQYAASNTLPAGVIVVVGDRFMAASGTAGQAALSVITTAGITGSTAVAKTLLTF